MLSTSCPRSTVRGRISPRGPADRTGALASPACHLQDAAAAFLQVLQHVGPRPAPAPAGPAGRWDPGVALHDVVCP